MSLSGPPVRFDGLIIITLTVLSYNIKQRTIMKHKSIDISSVVVLSSSFVCSEGGVIPSERCIRAYELCNSVGGLGQLSVRSWLSKEDGNYSNYPHLLPFSYGYTEIINGFIQMHN